MGKKIVCFLLSANCFFVFADAQQITVSGITTVGRFSTCAATNGQPVVTATFVSGNGSTVYNGAVVCLNPADSTVINFNIENIRWNQSPGTNWLHGVFFPTGGGITLTANTLGTGWIPRSIVQGAPCSAGLIGSTGYYYDGTTSNSCCGTVIANDGNPANNWGVAIIDCPSPFSISFQYRIINSAFTAAPFILKIRGTSDGATGCWSTPDNTVNYVQFQFSTISCGTPFTPPICNPAGNAILNAGLSGGTYQWQMSTDSVNFTNISDNPNYSGTNTLTLNLSNIPSLWYGYQYRCIVDGVNGHLYTLKFVDTWTGAVDTNWNNPGNWSCGAIPDAYTDAIINSGTVHVTADCSVRSVTTATGVSFTVDPGVIFTVVH